jgi:hypothetical protein
MSGVVTLAVLSDVHYASAEEQARGNDYEIRHIANPASRILLRTLRHFLWLRYPLTRNNLLEAFLNQACGAAHVVANGDYSCDSAFVGVSDGAAFESARECLDKLRARFGADFHAVMGDHELGKQSLAGGRGGMRLASYRRALDLGLERFWQFRLGRYVLIGITSSLVALPAFEPETLRNERSEWEQLRHLHLNEIRAAFSALAPNDRLLLFCHDPTALPFLWHEEWVRNRFPQIEQTVIGHLHSPLIFWKSRLLAGAPVIGFLGLPVRRITAALRDARYWQPFRVRLCPALAGIELLKDGGFYTLQLDWEARQPIRFEFHRLLR